MKSKVKLFSKFALILFGIVAWSLIVPNGGVAHKILITNVESELDHVLSRNLSEIIAENPVASRTYSRLQKHGTDVVFDHASDVERGLFGSAYKNQNRIEIYMKNHRSMTEAASTFIHEGAHMDRFYKGFKLSTQYEEYFAIRREYLFRHGTRPSLETRQKIWAHVLREYDDIPRGAIPVPSW